MTLTVRLFGLEVLHLAASTEDGETAAEADHDVASTILDTEPTGDLALGFVPPSVEGE